MLGEPGTRDLPAGCGPLLPGSIADSKPLRQQVFEQVRASGQAARADVTRALGVSAGSVTALTSDLIAMGLLREVEGRPRDSGRGRPPVALEVVPEAHLVVGLKLADERHSAVLVDFAGNHLGEIARPTTPHKKSAEEMVEETADLVEALLGETGHRLDDISAIGLGLSGIVDHATGTVSWSPLLSETEVPIRTMTERRFGCPVLVDNDANMLTQAELWFGVGRGMSDFAVVTIEHGVGMGLVLGNRLFRGSRGMGLELGHTKVQLDGALCRCGRRGCLEAYVADYALAREAATALDRPTRNLQSAQGMLEALYAQAKSGNRAAAAIFRRAGRILSLGLSNVVQLFDPELIILSGERMRYDYLYADEVLAEMERLSLSDGRPPARVEIHAWGDQVWSRGASAMALSAVTDATLAEGRT